MAHFVEERLDLLPAQEADAALCARGPLEVGHEHHDGQLEAPRAPWRRGALDVEQVRQVDVARQLGRVAEAHVVLYVVAVDAARAPHRVVRGARRLACARVQVAVDGADDAALGLVDDLELEHVRRPHLARLHGRGAEVDAVQQVEEARQPREHAAERQVRHERLQVRRVVGLHVDVREVLAVPRVHRRVRRRLEPAQRVDHRLRARALRVGGDVQEVAHVARRAGHLVDKRHLGEAALAGEHRELVARAQQALEHVDGPVAPRVRDHVREAPRALVGRKLADAVQLPRPRHDRQRVGAAREARLGAQALDEACVHRAQQVEREVGHLVARARRDVLQERPAEHEDLVAERDEALALLRRQVDARLLKVAQEDGRDRLCLLRHARPDVGVGHRAAQRVVEPGVGVEDVHKVAQVLVCGVRRVGPRGLGVRVAHELRHVDHAAQQVA